MLGITGNPGIGKTVISIFLVESLEQHFTCFQRTIQGPIYFFCESLDRKRNSDIAILRGLLHQLCRIHGMKHFYNECKLQKEPKENMLQSFQTLWRIFCQMIEDDDASGLIIIIDALDECDELSQKRLVERLSPWLHEKKRKVKVKFIMTCRHEQSIKPYLSHFSNMRDSSEHREQPIYRFLDVDSGKIRSDIRRYISDRVLYLSEKKSYTVELQQEVEDRLLQNAGGTFLWNHLIIERLDQLGNNQAVSECLRTLPDTLFGLYDKILERIPRGSEEYAHFVLQLVAAARRPLTKEEVLLAFFLQSSTDLTPGKPKRDDYRLREDIISSRSDLIYLKKADHGETLHFIHDSVKEYLLTSPSMRAHRLFLCLSYSSLACCLATSAYYRQVRTRLAPIILLVSLIGAFFQGFTRTLKMIQKCDFGLLKYFSGPKSTRFRYHVDWVSANHLLFRICFQSLGYSSPFLHKGRRQHEQPALEQLFQYSTAEMHSHAIEASEDVIKKFPWKSNILKRRDTEDRAAWWLSLIHERVSIEPPEANFVNLLLANGVNIKGPSNATIAWTLLAAQAEKGNEAARRTLQDRGLSSNVRTGSEWSPFKWALLKTSHNIVKMVLNKIRDESETPGEVAVDEMPEGSG